jgi:hypothetical protein
LRLRRTIQEEHGWKKLGGNADGCENKGVVKIATQKMLKRKGLKIDDLRALRVGEGRRDETGTRQQNLNQRIQWTLLFVK